jgi:hypothetical protein
VALFGRIFNRPSATDRHLAALAQQEIEAADTDAILVFQASIQALNAEPGLLSESLATQMSTSAPYVSINDMFLLGIMTALVEQRPTLPTPPHVRALLHVYKQLLRVSSNPEEAKQALDDLDAAHNRADPFWDRIKDFGYRAFTERREGYLAQAHRAYINYINIKTYM